MKTFKLHYTEINGNILCVDFKKHYDMIDFIDAKGINNKNKIIYLLYKKTINDIFISTSYLSIQDYLNKKMLCKTTDDYFIHECISLEKAFEIVLKINSNN